MNIPELKNRCKEIIRNAPALPVGIKDRCAYEEIDGQHYYFGGYIPFIGDKYGKGTRMLFLCTAQNIANRSVKVRRGYLENSEKALNRMALNVPDTIDIDCDSVVSGILPASAGLILLANNNLCEESLPRALQYMAVANFYKFSLREDKHDLHPERLPPAEREKYDSFIFDNYVRLEIEVLKPDYIFIFGMHRYKLLRKYIDKEKLLIKLFHMIDPGNFLYGMKLAPHQPLNHRLEKLIDIYCSYIKKYVEIKNMRFYSQYFGKTDNVRQYLRMYTDDVLRCAGKV